MRRFLIVFFGLGVVAAGGGWYAWTEIVPGPPQTLAIVPAVDIVVTPTARYQFSAQIRDARGRPLAMRPIWTSEAKIDETGLFVAPDKTGVYFVEAAVGGLNALAKVTVNAGAPKTVRVMPADATVKPRDSLPFSATAFDEWGNSVPAVPTWSVKFGSGTIDSSGVFIAGPSGTSTVSAEIDGIVATATATSKCGPSRTETAAGLSFTVICGVHADVWLNGEDLDAAEVTRTIDEAVVGVEGAFGRTLRHRLNVNVFATKEDFDVGLQKLLRVEPSPLEEGVFIAPALVAIDWDAPDLPLAIARHEITHLIVDEMAGRRVAVPSWLHEGLATMNEFAVSEETELVSRLCTASAAHNARLPKLSDIASPRDWRTYVNDVGVVSYFLMAQVASFIAFDAGGQANLLEKMGGGLPLEAAYEATSGRSFETFTAELGDRAARIAERYPGIAVTRRLADGSVVYVAYGEPGDSRVTVDIRNTRFGGAQTITTDEYGCAVGFIDDSWPRGTYSVTLTGPAGRATTTLTR